MEKSPCSSGCNESLRKICILLFLAWYLTTLSSFLGTFHFFNDFQEAPTQTDMIIICNVVVTGNRGSLGVLTIKKKSSKLLSKMLWRAYTYKCIFKIRYYFLLLKIFYYVYLFYAFGERLGYYYIIKDSKCVPCYMKKLDVLSLDLKGLQRPSG